MTEFIKSLKVIHQVLLVVSAAVLAFSLLPNRDPEYQEAERTLRLLQEQTRTSWEDFVSTMQLDQQNSESEYLNRLARRLDSTFAVQVYPTSLYTDLQFPLDKSLSGIKDYVRNNQTVQFIKLKREIPALLNQWDRSVLPPNGSQLKREKQPAIRITGLSAIPPGGAYLNDSLARYRTVPISSLTSDLTGRIQVTVDPTSVPQLMGNVISLNTRWELGERVEQPIARKWLEKDDKQHILFRRSKSTGLEVFPTLDPFWDEIAALPIHDARERLMGEKEAHRGKVSAFGLSVDAESTVKVTPWVFCSLVIFMIAHIRQARQLDQKIERGIPAWVGIFDDWTGRAVTFLTVPVLPVAASMILVGRHGRGSLFSASVESISLALLLFLAAWNYWELSRLRRRIVDFQSERRHEASAKALAQTVVMSSPRSSVSDENAGSTKTEFEKDDSEWIDDEGA